MLIALGARGGLGRDRDHAEERLLEAIKLYRETTGSDLLTAKRAVDALLAKKP